MQVDRRWLLVLSMVPGVGPQRLRSLIARFQSATAVFGAAFRDLVATENIDRKTAASILAFPHGPGMRDAIRAEDDQCARMDGSGARIITLWDTDYPAHLKRIYDPPPFLFARGTVEQIDSSAVAIVGTRSPSRYGVQIAERFAAELARLGITLVSGLARGVDTVVHEQCLAHGGRTIAVIGSGIDVPYPPENRGLGDRIAEHGAVLSEYFMGTKPDAGNFPRRNRIISGIALGTVVVETGIEGGAMITAATALDQNREVFAIPSSIIERRPSGTHRLIREGKALLVESVEEVLAELSPMMNTERPVAGKCISEPVVPLSLFEQRILEALSEDLPLHIDSLAEKTGLSTAELLGHLLVLELQGIARQLPGKFFLRV